MEEKESGLIFNFVSNWEYKDFALGGNLSSISWNEYREYYISIFLGFWQVFIGFRI